MSTRADALQLTAIAVATVLDQSAGVAAASGHAAPQCVRDGSYVDEALPLLVFRTHNAREPGGLLGTYEVDVELVACADSTTNATALLAAAHDALTPLVFAGVGLDAVPESGSGANSDPVDPDDAPFPEAFCVADQLTLHVFLP